jgi:hypothetical protein
VAIMEAHDHLRVAHEAFRVGRDATTLGEEGFRGARCERVQLTRSRPQENPGTHAHDQQNRPSCPVVPMRTSGKWWAEALGGRFNTIFAFRLATSRDLEARINDSVSAKWVAADSDARRNAVLAAAVRIFRARLLAAGAPVTSMEEAHARLLHDGEAALASFESEMGR